MPLRKLALAILALAALLLPYTAHAQNPDAANHVLTELAGHGYDVTAVGNYTDANGAPVPDTYYVQIETYTNDLDAEPLHEQWVAGFVALSRNYSTAKLLLVLLHYDHYLYVFQVSGLAFRQAVESYKTGDGSAWDQLGSQVRTGVRIWDQTAKQYLNEKDFTHKSQIEKKNTYKDFGGVAKPPLPPTNPDPNAPAENIWFDYSTTFLPADGSARAVLMTTLEDHAYQALPDRQVFFSIDPQGRDPKELGARQTNSFGMARVEVRSSDALGEVVARTRTLDHNAAGRIVIGKSPGTDLAKQREAIVSGLTSQGYADAAMAVSEYTHVTGKVYVTGIVQSRISSNAFDRAVYSQMARMSGTLLAVIPGVTDLELRLLWNSPDGHDYIMYFQVSPEKWAEFVNGTINEYQFWQSVQYLAAYDENGHRVGDKDFLNKNFGAANKNQATSAQRSVTSTLTQEEWGAQLNVGTFLIPVAGSGDNFTVEWSGGAQSFALYATPDFVKPILTLARDGDQSALQSLRLSSGQYLFAVAGDAPPAGVTLNYTEHLSR